MSASSADTTKTVAAYSDYLVDLAVNSEGDEYLLVKCPICEEEIAEGPTRSDIEAVEAHIATHDPEELGLTGEIYEYRPFVDILIEAHGLGPRGDDDSGGDLQHRTPEFVVFGFPEATVLDAVGVVLEEAYTPAAAEHREVVAAISDNDPAGYKEITEELDISVSTAQGRVRRLREAGVVEKIGTGHNGRYLFEVVGE